MEGWHAPPQFGEAHKTTKEPMWTGLSGKTRPNKRPQKKIKNLHYLKCHYTSFSEEEL